MSSTPTQQAMDNRYEASAGFQPSIDGEFWPFACCACNHMDPEMAVVCSVCLCACFTVSAACWIGNRLCCSGTSNTATTDLSQSLLPVETQETGEAKETTTPDPHG
jgi:hypothetical protein